MVRYATRRTTRYVGNARKTYTRRKPMAATSRYKARTTTSRAPAVPSYGRRNYGPVRQVTSIVPTTSISRLPRVEVKQHVISAGEKCRILADLNAVPKNVVLGNTAVLAANAATAEQNKLEPHIFSKVAAPLAARDIAHDAGYVNLVSGIAQGPTVNNRIGNSVMMHGVSVQLEINAFGRPFPLDYNQSVSSAATGALAAAYNDLRLGAQPVTWTCALILQNQVPTDQLPPTLTELWTAMFEHNAGSIEEHLNAPLDRYRSKAFGQLLWRKDFVVNGDKPIIKKTFNIRKKVECKYSSNHATHQTENRLYWIQFPSAPIHTGGSLFTTPVGADGPLGWMAQAIVPLTSCHAAVRMFFTDA